MADNTFAEEVANFILTAHEPLTVHREVSINPAAGNSTHHFEVELSACTVVATKGTWRSSASSSNHWYQVDVYDGTGDVLDSRMTWGDSWQGKLFDHLSALHATQVEATRRQILTDLGDRALD